MIREVEREKTETETVDVRICDRCGFECPNGGRKLYWGPSVTLTPEAEARLQAAHEYPAEPLKRSEASIIHDSLGNVELDHNGYVRLCVDCRDLLFSWTDAGPRGAEE
jgi:hypothetical protein